MPQYKRAEVVVKAESIGGIERAFRLAFIHIERGKSQGEDALPKHGIHVEWRVTDVVEATDVTLGSILIPENPLPSSASSLPDIAAMDIEEAKGIVGVAGNAEELEVLRGVEESSSRVPGGRKGVLDFIEKRREEFERAAEKVAKKAAGKKPESKPEPLV